MKKFNATPAQWNGEAVGDPEDVVFNKRYISQYTCKTGLVAIHQTSVYLIVEKEEFEDWLLGKEA